jgi:hypothetical protein
LDLILRDDLFLRMRCLFFYKSLMVRSHPEGGVSNHEAPGAILNRALSVINAVND